MTFAVLERRPDAAVSTKQKNQIKCTARSSGVAERPYSTMYHLKIVLLVSSHCDNAGAGETNRQTKLQQHNNMLAYSDMQQKFTWLLLI